MNTFPKTQNFLDLEPIETEVSTLELNLDTHIHCQHEEIENGYGRCSQCSCPGFIGSGTYTCQRSGCGHHWDEHW